MPFLTSLGTKKEHLAKSTYSEQGVSHLGAAAPSEAPHRREQLSPGLHGGSITFVRHSAPRTPAPWTPTALSGAGSVGQREHWGQEGTHVTPGVRSSLSREGARAVSSTVSSEMQGGHSAPLGLQLAWSQSLALTAAPEDMSRLQSQVLQSQERRPVPLLPLRDHTRGVGGRVRGEDTRCGSLPFSKQGADRWGWGKGSGPSSGQPGQTHVCCMRFYDLS